MAKKAMRVDTVGLRNSKRSLPASDWQYLGGDRRYRVGNRRKVTFNLNDLIYENLKESFNLTSLSTFRKAEFSFISFGLQKGFNFWPVSSNYNFTLYLTSQETLSSSWSPHTETLDQSGRLRQKHFLVCAYAS